MLWILLVGAGLALAGPSGDADGRHAAAVDEQLRAKLVERVADLRVERLAVEVELRAWEAQLAKGKVIEVALALKRPSLDGILSQRGPEQGDARPGADGAGRMVRIVCVRWVRKLVVGGRMISLALCAAAVAQPVPLVVEGDPVGPDVATTLMRVAVNDLGDWVVDTFTSAADPAADRVIVRNGVPMLVEGDPLLLPVGAAIADFGFDALALTDLGVPAWSLELSGTSGPSDDNGVYVGTDLVVQEGTVITAVGVVAGSTYSAFFDVDANEAGELVVSVWLREPGVGGARRSALLRLQADAGGALIAEELVAMEGDVLPGQVAPVFGVSLGDLDAFGHVMYRAQLDAAVADQAVYIDQTLIAQEDTPSPLPGRDYETLIGRPLSLSDSGHWALRANLTGDPFTDEVIVVDDVVVLQEGDSVPDIAPWSFTSFGIIDIANDGTLLVYGNWDDPTVGAGSGLFVDGRLVAQEGVTNIPGYGIIAQFENTEDGLVLSDNGRWLIFRATLDTGLEGAFLLDLGGLSLTGPSAPVAGGLNLFDVVGARPGASLRLAAALEVGAAPVPCASSTSTLDLGEPVRPLGSAVADAAGGATLAVNLPAGASGRTVRFQVVDTDTCAVSDVTLVTFP